MRVQLNGNAADSDTTPEPSSKGLMQSPHAETAFTHSLRPIETRAKDCAAIADVCPAQSRVKHWSLSSSFSLL